MTSQTDSNRIISLLLFSSIVINHIFPHYNYSYWFSLKCFFGGATCDYVPGLRGFFFIFMYLLAYIGSGLLLRYAEGATYLAVVQVYCYLNAACLGRILMTASLQSIHE